MASRGRALECSSTIGQRIRTWPLARACCVGLQGSWGTSKSEYSFILLDHNMKSMEWLRDVSDSCMSYHKPHLA
jgi:hypothetical protein